MNNSLEINYIKKCLALAEARLGWGDSHDWTSYDFEKLSETIREATGVTLSVTTLKRLWGKLKYDNIPATTTLNTLAQFAGYEDWREFKRREAAAVPGVSEQPEVVMAVKTKPRRRKWEYGLAVLLPLIIVVYLLFLSNTTIRINKEDYQFRSNTTVTSGVPNSVIFTYDASAAGNEKVSISQSWDIRRKVTVPADQKEYSTIYYTPGYFRAKLIIGEQIVKEHDLMISSGGWLALAEQGSGVPVYFKKEESLKDSAIVVDETLLSAYHLPLQPSPPKLRIYNVQDLGIRNDHFTFETSLKSEYREGTAACQRVEVLILCKNDMIMIPLCAEGCVGDLVLVANGTVAKSSNANLSGFGCDLSQWVKLKVEAKNKQMDFFVNGTKAYTLSFSAEPTDIVGLQYRFQGTAAVKNTRFTKDDRVIKL
ncbi:hypothetical protein [Chitinophaga niabensis]|uniref:Uncharacterized protein n=1 Tax=Chitinophaga niabensis TaxID=536979 RepID=A0A1N6J1R6_9BACT|nr:hypothetical protein [Chitinophaga niabensis]SIO38240.1 hypothetical protein SAMN04488055_3554 [Chitinophaga niabensis]